MAKKKKIKVKKLSAYQKLNRANKVLCEEINILVFEPDSSAAVIIKMRQTLLRNIENQVMAGSPTNP